jgi:hypothetical protein
MEPREVLKSALRPIVFQFASSSMHFAASLEICSHVNASADIKYFFWGAATPFPNSMNADNFLGPRMIPRNLKQAIHVAHQKVEFSTKFFYDKDWVDDKFEYLLEKVKKIDSMESLTQLDDEFLKPSAALSNCLTNYLRQRSLSYNKSRVIIKRALQSYLQSYSSAINNATKSSCDLGILFNGRFLHERACWDAFRNLGISTQIYEVTRDRYFLRPEGFHNRFQNQKYIEEFWEKSPDSHVVKEFIAKEYFEALRYGKNPFVRAPEHDSVNQENYFVYFANSDDEAFGFWESWQQPLGSQHEVIRELQRIFDERKREILIIRLHPNFANKSDTERDAWNSLTETPYSRIVGFEERVSSYSLMANAKGVLTFGSTIGLESAYWKKSVAVLADCHYDLIGVADKITDWDSLRKWIDSEHKLLESELTERHIASFKRPLYLAKAGEKFLNSEIIEIGIPGWGSWEAKSFRGISLKRRNLLIKFSRLLTKVRLSRLKLFI